MSKSVMPQEIFVYGTLMSSATGRLGEDMRLRLTQCARSLGPATVPGRLYDLGEYPACVPPQATGEVVHGEILHLTDPAATLPWLDDYEGIGRGQRAVGEYERIVVRATLASGASIDAWIYRFKRPVVVLEALADGRWRAKS